MALQVQNLPRVFKFKEEDDDDKYLPDPNPTFSAEEVMEFYAGQHPELTTARIVGPTVEEGKVVFDFVTNYGVKG